MLIFPPKDINGLYGYRAKFAMKNEDTRATDQKISAVSLMIVGVVYDGIEYLLELDRLSANVNKHGIILIAALVAMLVIAAEKLTANHANGPITPKPQTV